MTKFVKPDVPNVGDVPLLVAMVTWNPANRGGGAAVVHHPDTAGVANDYQRSDGACSFGPGGWVELTADGRMAKLFMIAWQAVARDGVDVADMHKALLVIPEFREQFPGAVHWLSDPDRADGL